MSWTLGIDTSSTTLSLGLLKDGEQHTSFSRYVKNSHSEHITSAINSFLSLAEITVDDITRCAVVTGPGSFTGLRIGISFAKGMFITKETSILPISTLQNMAFAAPIQEGIINVAIDARQDFLFFAQYEKCNNSFKVLKEDEKISKEQFLSLITDDAYTLYDTAGNTRSTLFETLSSKNSASLSTLNLSTGLSAALCAEQQLDSPKWGHVVNIFPNYMQESYAERAKK